MIEAAALTKKYGDKLAVDDLSFVIPPGRVTGFLGPNGAGKSTTMRMIIGLDQPTSGTVTVNGRPYRELPDPLGQVGCLLEARAVHTSRSARNHLRALAATHGIGRARVEHVIEMVGLEGVANKRSGGFSLGMGQRLGIASALLGDPGVVILDEPVNGLDPEGVRWVRDLLRSLAAEGRTVFLSSHLMSEMALTADHVIVLGAGRKLADLPVADLIATSSSSRVEVRTPDADRLTALLRGEGGAVDVRPDGTLLVDGVPSERVGELAAAERLVLHELTPVRASLEEAYLEMTRDAVEYHAHLDAPVEAR